MLPFKHITKTIAELLYKHDCVIVPNFGGFVARNLSSKFSKGNELLFPPSKQILFNKNLIHQDGLLLAKLADDNNLTHSEVSALLVDYVGYINSLLNAKKRFELDNIGLLYFDNDQILRFEAKSDVNFLIDSFGFEPVFATEIVIPAQTPIAPVTQFIDRKAVATNPMPVKKSKYQKMAVLAVGIPLIFGALLWAVSTKPIQPLLQSSVNPFYSPDKLYEPSNATKVDFIKIDDVQTLLSTKTDNNLEYFLVGKSNKTIIATNNTFVSTSKPINNATTKGASYVNLSGKYKVVVGCFGVEQNAKKLVKELIKNSVNAGISGLNAKGLHVVSCGSFNAKEDANNLLSQIKTTYPNAWIMAD